MIAIRYDGNAILVLHSKYLKQCLIREGLKNFMLERSCILIKYHYGNETLSLQPINKKDILKADKKLSSNKACIYLKLHQCKDF